MSNELPTGYQEGITRVSDVVSFVHPFDDNSMQRYLDWLKARNVEEEDYMKEAQDVGTFVHLQMEHYINKNPQDYKDDLYKTHTKEIMHGLEYLRKTIDTSPNLQYLPEVFVMDEDKRYQGTVDLVVIDERNKRVYIIDYKTWGIAKKKFNVYDEETQKWTMPNPSTKPYSKLKKVQLQLSLYGEYYRKKGYDVSICALWLHKEGAFDYWLDMSNSEDIDLILAQLHSSKIEKEYNLNIQIMEGLKVIIQSPTTKQYELTRVEYTLDKDKPLEKQIDDLVNVHKYTSNKLQNA